VSKLYSPNTNPAVFGNDLRVMLVYYVFLLAGRTLFLLEGCVNNQRLEG